MKPVIMNFNGRLFTFPLRTLFRHLRRALGVDRRDQERYINFISASNVQQMFQFLRQPRTVRPTTVNRRPNEKLVLRLTVHDGLARLLSERGAINFGA